MRRSRWTAATAAVAVALISAVLALVGATPARAAQSGGHYTPLATPDRILDTRLDADFPDKPCLAGEGITLQVTGPIKHSSAEPPTPATTGTVIPPEAAAVALNVTAISPSAGGWITVWPQGTQPTASSLNYVAGQIVPNMVIARISVDDPTTEGVDEGGKIRLTASSGCPHVAVDAVGWFSAAPLTETDRPANGGFRASTSSTPRIMDTRPAVATPPGNKGCVAANTPKSLDVTNEGGTPGTGVKAVALNVTVTEAAGNGWLTVYPNGVAQPPTASNLNFKAGQTVPNMVIVKVGDGDLVNFAAAGGGCPHVVVDVIGWFQTGAQEVGTFEGLTPARILDTRAGAPNGAPPCVSSERKVQVAGQGGVPALSNAKPADAVALNVTAVDASFSGFATVWPSGTTKPWTSNLNYPQGVGAIPNMVIARVGADGKVSIQSSEGCPDIIVDVVGWWAAADPALTAMPSPATFVMSDNDDVNKDTVITVTNGSAFHDPTKPTFAFTGLNAAQFSVFSTTCPTGSTGLAKAAECTVTVRWAPPAGDTAIPDTDAQLTIASGLGVTTVELDGSRPPEVVDP